MSRWPLRRVRRRLCAEFSMMSCTARNSSASGPFSGACAPARALVTHRARVSRQPSHRLYSALGVSGRMHQQHAGSSCAQQSPQHYALPDLHCLQAPHDMGFCQSCRATGGVSCQRHVGGMQEWGGREHAATGHTCTARCCRCSLRKGRGCVAARVDCRPSRADTSFLPASCVAPRQIFTAASPGCAAGR